MTPSGRPGAMPYWVLERISASPVVSLNRAVAAENYRVAAHRTASLPERHHLTLRAAQLAAHWPEET